MGSKGSRGQESWLGMDSTIQDRCSLGRTSPPLRLHFSLLPKEHLADAPTSLQMCMSNSLPFGYCTHPQLVAMKNGNGL